MATKTNGNGFRSTWKGTLGLSLMSFPVKLYKARVSKEGTGLKLICSCGAPVEQKYRCTADGKLSTRSECQHGYEMPDGNIMPVPETALDNLPLKTCRAMDILGFVRNMDYATLMDPRYIKEAYYVVPDKGGEKQYSLLAAVMQSKDVTAFTKVSFRDQEQPVMVVWDDALQLLTLYTLAYPDEVKAVEPGQLFRPVVLLDKEKAVGEMLVDKLTLTQLPEFTNEYKSAFNNMIEALATGTEIPQLPAAQELETDLLSTLMAAVGS